MVRDPESRKYREVLKVVGNPTGPNSRQTQMALREFRNDKTITALYGFSAGGYNVLHILHALTPDERNRLDRVVVLGAPLNPEELYRAEGYEGGLGNWSIDLIRMEATWTARARCSRHRINN